MKKMLMLATTAAMIEQFNKNNILILEEMGYEVHVAGNWKQGNPISEERLEKFKEWLGGHHGRWYQIPAVRNPADLEHNLKAYKIVIKLIKENHYEFIHCHTPIGSVIGRVAAHFTHTKIVYTAHGFHFFKGAPLKNWLLYYPVEKFLSRWTDVLITINQEDYERARKKFHMKRLEKIPGVGIDLDKYGYIGITREEKRKELGISEDTVVLLSVGELIERKNHEMVIRAVARLREQTEIKIKYLIAGQGVLEEKYKKLIEELHLGQEVELLGFRNDISELCEASDIFLFPSAQEGLSVALMEAMASGLPCIVSDIRGNTDLITNDVGGFCVKYQDINEWSKKIKLLSSDKTMREKLGEANREEVKNYSIEKVERILKENAYFGGVRHLQKIVLMDKAVQLRKELDIKTRDMVLISVGELNSNKNHEIVIRALAQLHNPEIQYVICGQGELKEYLKQLAEKFGVGNCVKLLGYRNDIPELLSMADVFVFPSKREGLGLAALEAMASGLPLISSYVGGIKDYARQGVTGCCIEHPTKIHNFIFAIKKMYQDSCFRGKCSKQNRTIANSFNIMKVKRKMIDVYKGLDTEK